MQEKTIITISRQFGSGGKEIAEILAEKMGVRCYDRQILYLAAEKMGDTEVDIESILESAYRTPDSSIGSMGPMVLRQFPTIIKCSGSRLKRF